MSAVLNRLSKQAPGEVWTSHPVVNKSESKERGTEWELEPYGSVLCHTIFERDDSASWLYKYAIGPEDLSLYERKIVLDTLADLDHIDGVN